MLAKNRSEKIIELVTRAIAINKEVLHEEERLIDALKQQSDRSLIELISNRINTLMRKENLYTGAAFSLLHHDSNN